MSDIKWIKVAVDMFEDSKIEFIRSLPEGDAIIVTWIQMLSIAGQSNMGGYLMVTEGIPYTEQLLSNKLRRQPVLLQFALETLIKLKMINIEDGPFHISKWEKHQNVEGMEKVRLQTNERVRKHRTKEKEKLETLPCNATVTLQVTQCNATELEVDLELDLDKENNTTTPELLIQDEYANLHGKFLGHVKQKEIMAINDLVKNAIPTDFILSCMHQLYREKMDKQEPITSFLYYPEPIKRLWKEHTTPKVVYSSNRKSNEIDWDALERRLLEREAQRGNDTA